MTEIHSSKFVQVGEGQKFNGGILTKEGAAEVNGARAAIASGRREPLSLRIAKAMRKPVDTDLLASDKAIFPWLK